MHKQMQKIITPEQAKAIVAEINAWHVEQEFANMEKWQVVSIAQLYNLSEECYLARFSGGLYTVFCREGGKLLPTGTFTMRAPDFIHPSHEHEQAS